MTKRISNPPPPVKDKPPYVGNTPVQLGQIEAADAMMIDGKIVTRDDYRALAAQVEAFRSAMLNACNVTDLSASKEQAQAVYRMESVLQAAPQHHLREVRAEAGRAGFVEGVRQEMLDKFGLFYLETQDRANQYAEQIRRGEVE